MRTELFLTLAALTGCVPTPEAYSIPPQHEPSSAPEELPYSEYVRAADRHAESYFIQDIKTLEGTFRWTHANPELRFFLKQTENRTFKLEFGIHPVLIKDTGSLEMTILVNDHLLATVRHDTWGDKVFAKAVPKAWLVPNGDNIVKIRVKKPWQADKNVYLGFVFYAAGFV